MIERSAPNDLTGLLRAATRSQLRGLLTQFTDRQRLRLPNDLSPPSERCWQRRSWRSVIGLMGWRTA